MRRNLVRGKENNDTATARIYTHLGASYDSVSLNPEIEYSPGEGRGSWRRSTDLAGTLPVGVRSDKSGTRLRGRTHRIPSEPNTKASRKQTMTNCFKGRARSGTKGRSHIINAVRRRLSFVYTGGVGADRFDCGRKGAFARPLFAGRR